VRRHGEVTIQGRTQQSVILTGMHINITTRHPEPSTGIVVSTGQCGGGVTKRRFDVNLAALPPTFAAKPEVDDFTGQVTSPGVNFPYKILLTDPEVFDLTKACAGNCTFTVVLDWWPTARRAPACWTTTATDSAASTPHPVPRYQLEPGGMKLRPKPGKEHRAPGGPLPR
jgi:hypothetical protein